MIVKEWHPELETGTNDKEAEGSPEVIICGSHRRHGQGNLQLLFCCSVREFPADQVGGLEAQQS